jgi:hypothetical protein
LVIGATRQGLVLARERAGRCDSGAYLERSSVFDRHIEVTHNETGERSSEIMLEKPSRKLAGVCF